jgi:predicted phosphoribosyltransferase
VRTPSRFLDRREAGRELANHLGAFAGRDDVTVLGLPRGGIPVAYEVARTLGAPLEAFVVRKIGAPRQEELAMGAIATGNVRVLDGDTIRMLNVAPEVVERVIGQETRELERRERLYRGAHPFPDLHGRTALLVDDGIATGASMTAAVRAVRALGAARVVVAVPVAPPETVERLRREADDCICVLTPPMFFAVGAWYADFSQTGDDEVVALLADARETMRSPRQGHA